MKPTLMIPIAGFGSRFRQAGFTTPKQMLELSNGRTCLEESLSSVQLEDFNLVFVIRRDQEQREGFREFIESLQLEASADIFVLERPTAGSTETCLAALETIDPKSPLYIFTMDVSFSPRLNSHSFQAGADGGLLTFTSNSPSYSYARVDGQLVTETAEKRVISDAACAGVYYFATGALFKSYATEMLRQELTTNGEYYLAPLFNLLIADGLRVIATQIETIDLFGTPEEFEFVNRISIPTKKNRPRIGLACDHSGFKTKELAKQILSKEGFEFSDFGAFSESTSDYNDFVGAAARAIQNNDLDFALGFCRSGQGISISSQHHDWIISALIYDVWSAEFAVRHNGANFFSLPARIWEDDQAGLELAMQTIVGSSFDGGRHQDRIQRVLRDRHQS